MPQYALEAENISPIPEIADRKGMAEGMRRAAHANQACSLTAAFYLRQDPTPGHRPAILGKEEAVETRARWLRAIPL